MPVIVRNNIHDSFIGAQPSLPALPLWEKKGLVYKVAFCRLSEVNFIRSTARCASHVTQSSSLLMKCCIQISACGLKGIRPW